MCKLKDNFILIKLDLMKLVFYCMLFNFLLKNIYFD